LVTGPMVRRSRTRPVRTARRTARAVVAARAAPLSAGEAGLEGQVVAVALPLK